MEGAFDSIYKALMVHIMPFLPSFTLRLYTKYYLIPDFGHPLSTGNERDIDPSNGGISIATGVFNNLL